MTFKIYQKAKNRSFVFLLIVFIASCNTYKQTSDYPIINTVHQNKAGIRPINCNKLTRHNSSAVETAIAIQTSASEQATLSPAVFANAERVKRFDFAHNLKSIPKKSALSPPFNYDKILTASASNEPESVNLTYIPDTIKTHNHSIADSAKNSIVQDPPVYQDKGKKETQKHNRFIFAIISLTAALLFIPFLYFGIPGVLLLGIIAIVFGALGLKSNLRIMAFFGMYIGIILVSLSLAFILLTLFIPE
jgi:hypothetical protein